MVPLQGVNSPSRIGFNWHPLFSGAGTLVIPNLTSKKTNPAKTVAFFVPGKHTTGMSMVLSKWIITPIYVGCKSHKKVINQLAN